MKDIAPLTILNGRIVLPEGEEPRTVRAAAICAEVSPIPKPISRIFGADSALRPKTVARLCGAAT